MSIRIEIQIACVILTALFFLAFGIAREPRGWRRLFQSMFAKSGEFSVNKNKAIDESLKRNGIVVAMIILVIDVGLFVWGITESARVKQNSLTPEERAKMEEIKRIGGSGFKQKVPPS